MTKQEEEVIRLIGFGYFDTVIASQLGMDREEVHKIRMEARK
jgi:DNA-binding NarL/FixJ family response regulator